MPRTPFAIALAASALFLAQAFAAPAIAGAAIYVDDGGSCAGLTPCFTTIQEGVDNAGPSPAQVLVFPGDYTESVDLTQMGSAIGGGMGDLTLSGVDENGLIQDPYDLFDDPLIHVTGARPISALPLFTGSLSVSEMLTAANVGPGVEVVASGDVEVQRVTANNPPAGRDGVSVESTTGSVTLAFVDGNEGTSGGGGVAVTAHEDAQLTFVDSNENGGSGANGITVEAGRDAFIEFSEASSNNAGGLTADAGRDLRLENFVARSNGGDGANLTAARNITLFGNRLDSNAGSGLVAEAGERIAMDEVGSESLYSNGGLGGDLRAPVINLDGIYAVGNGGHGMRLRTGDFTMTGTTAAYNGGDGIAVEPFGGSVAAVHVTGSHFEKNTDNGVDLVGLANAGAYMLTGNAYCFNGTSGLKLESNATVDATKSWWEDISGPTHPTTGGTGEPVIDSANGGAGNVDFTPWIDSGDISIADPGETLQARLGTSLLVRLFAGGESVFGDLSLAGSELALAEPKPLLTTANGGFASGGDQGQTLYTTAASPYYVPQHAGPAQVTWTWSCAPDLELTQSFDVAPSLPWGDVNCDGVVDLRDVTDFLAMYGFLIGAAEGCESIFGDLAFYVFGNWDCDDDLSDPRDVILVLRHLAGIAALPDPNDCPAVGDIS